MDLNEFRSFISESGVDIWTWIDLSISVACTDHEKELRNRRDGIIHRLYSPAASSTCHTCSTHNHFKQLPVECKKKNKDDDVGFEFVKAQPLNSTNEIEEEDDDQLKKQILQIKTLLDDQNQSDECLIDLLQRLAAMDTSFQTLKDTDIGRHVSKLRKHSCNEVRKLVKFLVRKWKDTVDEWVRLNTPLDEVNQFNAYDKTEEGHHESSASTPPKEKMKYNEINESADKLGSAKKRPHLHNSQETHPASKQRREIREFHNGPKLKNTLLGNNGGSVFVRNW